MMSFLTNDDKEADVNQRYRPITRLGLGGTGLGDMYHTTSDEAAMRPSMPPGTPASATSTPRPHYGAGLSEHRFGQALRRRPRDEYTLSTKVGRLLAPHMPGEIEAPFVGALPFRRVIDYTADGVRRAVEDSLQRLALGHIDIAYVHDLSPDMFGSEFEHHYRIAAGKGGAFEGMVRLREEGIIKGWGLGVNTVEPCLRALRESDPDIFLLAGRYTLMETTPLAELFPLCAAARRPRGAGRPLQLRLPGRRRALRLPAGQPEQARAARAPAPGRGRHGVDLAAAALQFGAAHPVVAATIPGASSPEHLRRNAP
jgi:D-threo-aldose 1-dehydrogenase